jgi:uncharacterized membrane protein YjdF
VEQPFGARQLPVFLCLPALLSFVAAYPLVDWWAPFSRQMARETARQSVVRSAGSLGIAAVGLVPAAAAGRLSQSSTSIVLTLLWWSLSTASVAVLDRLYWLPSLLVTLLVLPALLTPDGRSGTVGWATSRAAVAIAICAPAVAAALLAWRRSRR